MSKEQILESVKDFLNPNRKVLREQQLAQQIAHQEQVEYYQGLRELITVAVADGVIQGQIAVNQEIQQLRAEVAALQEQQAAS